MESVDKPSPALHSRCVDKFFRAQPDMQGDSKQAAVYLGESVGQIALSTELSTYPQGLLHTTESLYI